jgi:hypothetical protein
MSQGIRRLRNNPAILPATQSAPPLSLADMTTQSRRVANQQARSASIGAQDLQVVERDEVA